MFPFFLSLDDNLIKTFSNDKMRDFFKKLVLKNNESINHPTLNKIIEKAQKKNEYQNYSIRRILFEFDSVVDKQRNIVYAQRDVIMGSDDIRSGVFDIVGIYTEYCIEKFILKNADLNGNALVEYMEHYNNIFDIKIDQGDINNI